MLCATKEVFKHGQLSRFIEADRSRARAGEDLSPGHAEALADVGVLAILIDNVDMDALQRKNRKLQRLSQAQNIMGAFRMKHRR